MGNMDKGMDKNTEMSNNKTQSAVVAALVIGLLAGFFIGRSWGQKYEEEGVGEKVKVENVDSASSTEGSVNVKEVSKDSPKEQPKAVIADKMASGDVTGEVAVVDQNAGMTVNVSKVTLSDAGWVVVREDMGNGMGNILGALWLPAGTKSDASVELLRGTQANKNYFVALYNDNGDKKFDKTVDLPIAVAGKIVSGVFSAK